MKAKSSNFQRARNHAQDYSEAATIHGLVYIGQRSQPLCHRCLWFAVVCCGVTVAVFLSLNALWQWQDDPIITSVKTTALPIDELEYPAITICGQGMSTDTLESVLSEQFNSWLRENGIDTRGLTADEIADFKKNYQKEKFPGLEIPMDQVVAMMTNNNPTAAVSSAAIAIAAIGELSKLRGGCPRGWTSSTEDSILATTYCYRALEERMNFSQAKTSCQKEKSILLEFDTVGEVEDFQRLVKDEHLGITEEQAVWLGINYIKGLGYTYQYNQMDAAAMLGLKTEYQPGLQLDCSSFNSTNGNMVPVLCKSTQIVVCTIAASFTRRRRMSEIVEQEEYIYTLPPSRSKRSVEEPKFDVFLNPAKKALQKENVANLTDKFQQSFNGMDLESSFFQLFQILWYSVNPCFDVRGWTSTYRDQKSTIKRCKWKGMDVNCSAIFKTNPTDRGMCCSFNALAAEEIYRNSKFSESVAALQKSNLADSFEAPVTTPKGWGVPGMEPRPEIGKHRGLTLIIDSHSDILSPSTIQDDYEGFQAVVNSKSSFPSLLEKGFVVRPGHENLVAMGAISTIAEHDIHDIPKKVRNCLFSDEHKLEMHQHYSQSACTFECKLAVGRKKTGGCTPWYYPSTETNICDPWSTTIFLEAILGGDIRCKHCLPDCEGTIYTSAVSATPLRRCDTKNIGLTMLCKFDGDVSLPAIWSTQVLEEYRKIYPDKELPDFLKDHVKDNAERVFLASPKTAIFKGFYKTDGDNKYNAFEKDIAVVHFFFQEPTVFQFLRANRMTWVDFISQIGGLLGLFLGFSLISGIELLYWVTLRLADRFCSSSEERQSSSGSRRINVS